MECVFSANSSINLGFEIRLFVNLLSVTSGVFGILFQQEFIRYILNKKKKGIYYIKKNKFIIRF
jgi:hypothetical protein